MGLRTLAVLLPILALACGAEPGPGTDAGGVQADAPEGGRDAVRDVDYERNEEIPSVVTVIWQQGVSAESWVQVRFADEDWQPTPVRQREPGRQEQIVLGIPYDQVFEAQVVVRAGGTEQVSETISGTTGPVPDEVPVPELRVLDEGAIEPSGRYLFTSVVRSIGPWSPSGSYWAIIIDRRGRLVWARRTPREHATVFAQVSRDGRDLLIDDNTYWFNFDASQSRVLRLKIDGSVAQAIDTPGLHHPFVELPDGALVWGATRSATEETLEQVGPDGQRSTLWDSTAYLSTVMPAGLQSCFQSNGLYWDEPTDTFLFSSFCDFYVVQIARSDGSVPRVLGGILPESFRTSPDAPLVWQHAPHFTPDRTLMMAMHEPSSGNEAVVREYTIDDVTKTLEQVWSWKDGLGTSTQYAFAADRLANGNTLVDYGTTPLLREVTRAGDIVWEVRWTTQCFVGRSTLIHDLYPLAP